MIRKVNNSKLKYIIKTVFIIFGISFLLTVLFSCDTISSYYPSYEDAVKDGAIERGWIHPDFPHSIKNIHEKHDLDTNKIWMSFKYNKDDLDLLLEDIVVIDEFEEIEEVRKKFKDNFGLFKSYFVFNNKALRFYKYKNLKHPRYNYHFNYRYLAINEDKGIAYYTSK